MADQVLQSPKKPHFLQPLLPGFHSHLSIPLTFFSKHIEGRNEKSMVKLTSDACEKTWKVKMEGRRLTAGWKDFADAHGFRVGDIIIFRHNGDFLFHVTGLGPSCCEIQYVQSRDYEEEENIRNLKKEPESPRDDDDDKDNMTMLRKKKQMKKRTHKEEAKSFGSKCVFTKHSSKEKKIKTGESSQSRMASTLSEHRFVTLTVTPYSLKVSRLYLPMNFTRLNKMEKAGGKEIILLDKHGVEWPVSLSIKKKNSKLRLGSGLKEFFKAIGVKANESFVMELVWEDKTNPLFFKFCSKIKTGF